MCFAIACPGGQNCRVCGFTVAVLNRRARGWLQCLSVPVC